MRKNNRGFTLIEILAAVTILGILSVTAVVSVNHIIQKAKEEHYIAAEDQLKMAGQSFTQQNRSALPKAIGQKTKVQMKTLVDKNYIKEIKDYSDNPCDSNDSYVQVFKYSQNDYSYVSYLECPTYTSKEIIEKGSPKISLETSDPEKSKKATVAVKISDNEKLLSWSYIIYKDGKEVKNSGSTQLPNYDKSISKTISLAKYTPGKVKVVVTATNIYGLTTTKSTGTINYKDTQGPTCIIKSADNKDNPKQWTKGPVTITVGCDDGEGVGCTKAEFSKTFKTTTDVGTITIEDKEGNKTACKVSVNIDVTPPTVPQIKTYKWKNNSTRPTTTSGLSSYTANTWSALNIFAKASGSTDSGSGLDKYQYTIDGAAGNIQNRDGDSASIETTGTSTIKYRACDKLGNCSAYSSTVTIKVDKVAPTIPTTGSIGSVSGSNKNASIKTPAGGSADKESGFKRYLYLIKTTSGTPAKTDSGFTTSTSFTRACGKTYYAYVIAEDNVGNRSEVKSLGTTFDGADAYSAWSTCSKTCGGGTQTRTNSCALITTNLSQNCNSQDCCSEVTYKDGTTCSAKCNGGTYNRLAYSKWDSSKRCSSKDLASGGSACNTQNCCSSTTTTWGNYGACSVKCGGGTQTRTGTKYSTYDGRNCGADSSSQPCNAQACCSSTVISSYSAWSSCSKTCGGGKKYKTANLVSAYDSSIRCGTQAKAKSADCNTQACCSVSNTRGCKKVKDCRQGTYIHKTADVKNSSVVGVLKTAETFYVVKTSGNFYYGVSASGIKGYVYKTCTNSSGSYCANVSCKG